MTSRKLPIFITTLALGLAMATGAALAADACDTCGPRTHHAKKHAVAADPAEFWGNPYYTPDDHADTIAISAGNAAAANIAVQTENPWPAYLNDMDFENSGEVSDKVMLEFLARHAKQDAPPPTVNFNIVGAK
ncbi:MAG: hypothetical protein KGO53_00960 [Alphaproteobacteria bacterium]|nr:hypothetical protein [Alphaproteobacteria bacterium]